MGAIRQRNTCCYFVSLSDVLCVARVVTRTTEAVGVRHTGALSSCLEHPVVYEPLINHVLTCEKARLTLIAWAVGGALLIALSINRGTAWRPS